MTYAPARRPTMYFVGVSTARSSIRRVFPLWAERLGLDAELVGVDFRLGAPADEYRRFVSFLAGDPLSAGALVTTHKIDLFESCRSLFAGVDQHARVLGETSCLSKDERGLHAHAKDPMTSGLALRAFIPEGHWRRTRAAAFVIGAGGAASAISWYLRTSEDEAPSRLVISDRDPQRLEKVRSLHAKTDGDSAVETLEVRDAHDNDRVLGSLPRGSLVVNATGMGKDLPGSPLSEGAVFPLDGLAWELNYRGELVFLEQARSQAGLRSLVCEDGWTYFVHGWLQAIAEVFHLAIATEGEAFDELTALAEGVRR
jgi:shikimate 5-dehydrogenase